MAARQKFKVPSASDVDNSNSDVGKKFSLFKNYQQNKEKSGGQTGEAGNSVKSASIAPAATGSSSAALKSSSVASESSSSSRSSPSTSTISSTSSSLKPLAETEAKVLPRSDIPSSSVAATALAKGAASTEALGSTNTSKSSTQTSSHQLSVTKPASSNSIIVNYRQRGNPILKHIRNVPWEYGSIIPDYVMGVANCALFLSLRYHQLHPEYLHNRLKELGKGYDLRVLLVQVDVKDPYHQLKDLAKICILADLTLILAFSPEEAGRYLEAYKVYENKPAEVLMEKTETDFVSKLTECLTTVKSVNKTDCMTLLSAFKSMNGIVNASKEDIALCAGFGPQKAQRLHDVFHEPFLKARKRLKTATGDSKSAGPVQKPS